MIERFRQFYRALFAQVSPEDMCYVDGILTAEEKILFLSMDIIDQAHAISVARTAERLSMNCTQPVDNRLLCRVSLLHDIGRQKGDLGLMGKVITVLLHTLFPVVSKKMATKTRSSFIQNALFVYYNHPWIGAERLRSIGLEVEAHIIENHHKENAEDDCIELILLRAADALN